MSAYNGTNNNDQRLFSYLAGIGVSHSIAPPMHDFVAKALGYNWTFIAKECPTIEDLLKLFREPNFAGGVVTMPYKVSIMHHLDGLDEHATLLKACNNVYRAPDGSLRGTNTDWRGVKGCLNSGTQSGTCAEGRGKPSLLVGAGGAARAALYVLHRELGCRPIYLVNRERGEIEALVADAKGYGEGSNEGLEVIHLDSVERARTALRSTGCPYYVVGTVPDFEPQLPAELEARDILEYVFAAAADPIPESKESGGVVSSPPPPPPKGVLLDMCFKPRRTRTIKLAERYGWATIDGTGIIGHQIEEQYRLWCGGAVVTEEIKKGAWDILNKAADESKMINF